ncbi:sulfate adenylyltransferase subunit CysD [Planctomycetota bacterium]
MNRLEELENRSIYIIREAYSHFKKIAMLWSMGKDSTVLLELARKAFMGTVPFPVIHIDTGKKFECMYAFREKLAKQWDLNLIIAKNTSQAAQKIDHNDKLLCCSLLKTETLKQVVTAHDLNGIMLGIRRDEHGIRAKERHFSPRDDDFKWDYQNQPPELWDHFESDTKQNTHIRIHPLLEWTELDIWRYIKKENIPVVELYFSKNGKRYRSIGCEPCCQPIISDVDNIDEMIEELENTRISERQGRAQDKESAYAMQQLRALGYM